MSLPFMFRKRTGDEHGNLFDHGRGAVSLLLWNPLFLYRKMGLYVCQILAGGGDRALFDDSCDKRRSDAKAFVLLCGGNMDPFSCGGVFYCTCHEAWKKEELPVSDRAWCAGPGRADHRFIKEKTGCCFIVSSGLSFGEDHRIRRSGKGEDVSEAYAMAQYLREHEVKDEQIMLEDQSRTTRENLRFSKAYLEEVENTGWNCDK